MTTCCGTTASASRDEHHDVVVGDLGVFHDDVEVAIVVEDPGVQQLVLRIVLTSARVCDHQVGVRERTLGVLVQALHVGVGGGVVEVKPVLLDVLAVVALPVGESKEPLLDDRIRSVPQGEGKAQALAPVADARDSILAPAIRARARVVMGKVLPRVPVGAVVLAHRSPLTLTEVGPPRPPRNLADPRLLEALVLRRTRTRLDRRHHGGLCSLSLTAQARPACS